MRLKVNDTEDYNLTLDLNVNYEHECISVSVTLWDKKKHTINSQAFAGDEFHKALSCYRQFENTYFGARNGGKNE